MSRVKKTKPLKYITPEEGAILKEKFIAKIALLESKLNNVTEEYVSEGQKEKINRKKIQRLSKKKNRLTTRIQKIKVDITKIDENKYLQLNVFQKTAKYFSQLPYAKQKIIYGILFLLPWFIGFCIFFASPIIRTFAWSFQDIDTYDGWHASFIGFKNYVNLFTVQTLTGKTVLELLVSSMSEILINLPIIIILSLFLAVVLNTKFKGHKIIKTIFFIPVIYNVTLVNEILTGAFGDMASAGTGEGFMLVDKFSEFLMNIGIGGGLVEFLISAVNRIFSIINMSGIQILIFIAALQSVPKHLYEAAIMEGATKYEMFWKITIPMVSPMILTCIVFTIVDRFGSTEIMRALTVISDGAQLASNHPGMYSAVSVVYFAANALIIAIAFILMRKAVFYYDK